MLKKLLFLSLLFISFFHIDAQDLYDLNKVREVRIEFDREDWAEMLDSLKQNGGGRLLASVKVDGNQLDSVGVRFKGNSSYFNVRKNESTKLPFNIKANHVIKKQRFPNGYGTLKLSNVFRDPSFVREVLSYEIAGNYMAAPKANFVQVYVNGKYLGLYNSTESVDSDFLDRNFGEHKGAFFKCDPVWSSSVPDGCSSGDKASLLYQGKDTTCYFKNYEIKSKYGWAELQRLTEVLNKNPDEIESVLNVDEVLWMLAFNNVLANLDSYNGRLCHNYYMYQDQSGRFRPVVWDMNLSFGGFRFADDQKAMTNEELQKMSPFLHYKYEKRPLISKLLQRDLYRKIYVAHVKTILEEHFVKEQYLSRINHIQQLIGNYVKEDNNKLYTYDAFIQNVNQTTEAKGSKIIGIKELMSARTAYLKNHPIMKKEAPEISEVTHKKDSGKTIITARVTGAKTVYLAFREKEFGHFTKVKMKDDGTENDGADGDQQYGITMEGTTNLQYYLIAEADKTASLSPTRAAYEYHQMK